jgi:hypothetical protein
MEWEELLAEFRALGGVAENVRLGVGPFGRGVFAIDPTKESIIHASDNLFVPYHAVEVRDGQMTIATGAPVGARERAFFENYERHFGWGSGSYEEVWHEQEAWNHLPADVVDFIMRMGASPAPDQYFLPPTPELCLRRYVDARDFTYKGKRWLVPVVDLVNHSPAAPSYDTEVGVAIRGTYESEMLARYNARDAWAHVLGYHFADVAGFAYSLAISVDIFGRWHVAISREIDQLDLREGIRYPKATIEGNTIGLSFLTLGNSAAPDLPRATFRNVVREALSAPQADLAFDSIARFSKHKFLDLLSILRKHDGPVIRLLETAAINQLRTLADCVGARSLPD